MRVAPVRGALSNDDHGNCAYESFININVPADSVPRWQEVHQSRSTQPVCTDVLDWMTPSAFLLTFSDSDSLNLCNVLNVLHGKRLTNEMRLLHGKQLTNEMRLLHGKRMR